MSEVQRYNPQDQRLWDGAGEAKVVLATDYDALRGAHNDSLLDLEGAHKRCVELEAQVAIAHRLLTDCEPCHEEDCEHFDSTDPQPCSCGVGQWFIDRCKLLAVSTVNKQPKPREPKWCSECDETHARTGCPVRPSDSDEQYSRAATTVTAIPGE